MNITREVLISAIILSILLIVSGAEQCPQGGSFGGLGGGGTSAAGSGVDFALQSGIDKLTSGKEITLGDSFFVDVLIENYDPEPRAGQICIRDDIDDAYGGISDFCKQFSIEGATYVGDAFQSSATKRIAFPENGYYKYENLPAELNAKAYTSMSYTQHSVISGAVKAPLPEQETISLLEKASPLGLSVEKTITSREESVKANLKITFTKKGNYNITSTDFKKEAIQFSSQLGTYNLDCPEVKQGFVDFKNTKFISCSALLPREQITHPLIISLDYGVKLSKETDFKIKKAL